MARTNEASPHQETRFAHKSEALVAQLLDSFGIAWQYEPREFVLERNSAGFATNAFKPDFYLPEFDRYLEVTTMSQRLVTKKNRKARLLKEVFPEISICLLYRRDIDALLAINGLSDVPAETEGVDPLMLADLREYFQQLPR